MRTGSLGPGQGRCGLRPVTPERASAPVDGKLGGLSAPTPETETPVALVTRYEDPLLDGQRHLIKTRSGIYGSNEQFGFYVNLMIAIAYKIRVVGPAVPYIVIANTIVT